MEHIELAHALIRIKLVDDSDTTLHLAAILALATAELGYVPAVSALWQHDGSLHVVWTPGTSPTVAENEAFNNACGRAAGRANGSYTVDRYEMGRDPQT